MATFDISLERVAARAYERFAARGYAHGHDLEDWLAAEEELQTEAAAPVRTEAAAPVKKTVRKNGRNAETHAPKTSRR